MRIKKRKGPTTIRGLKPKLSSCVRLEGTQKIEKLTDFSLEVLISNHFFLFHRAREAWKIENSGLLLIRYPAVIHRLENFLL